MKGEGKKPRRSVSEWAQKQEKFKKKKLMEGYGGIEVVMKSKTKNIVGETKALLEKHEEILRLFGARHSIDAYSVAQSKDKRRGDQSS